MQANSVSSKQVFDTQMRFKLSNTMNTYQTKMHLMKFPLNICLPGTMGTYGSPAHGVILTLPNVKFTILKTDSINLTGPFTSSGKINPGYSVYLIRI